MANIKRFVVPFVLVNLLAAGAVFAQSAWLPEPGRFVSSGAVVHQTFDQFYRGSELRPTPFGDLEQTTYVVGLERRINDSLAIDGTLGYATTSGTTESGLGESGLADTNVGLRWRVADEFATPGTPTVTLRLGGIVEGSYDIGTPAAPGDGASGVTGSVMVGKTFGVDSSYGVHGSAGYRTMAEDVPDAVFGSISTFKGLGRHTVSAAYRYDGCTSGIDIGSPGFTPDRFPETKEVSHALELGWAFGTARKGTWSLALARTLTGRNTDRKSVLMLGVTY